MNSLDFTITELAERLDTIFIARQILHCECHILLQPSGEFSVDKKQFEMRERLNGLLKGEKFLSEEERELLKNFLDKTHKGYGTTTKLEEKIPPLAFKAEFKKEEVPLRVVPAKSSLSSIFKPAKLEMKLTIDELKSHKQSILNFNASIKDWPEKEKNKIRDLLNSFIDAFEKNCLKKQVGQADATSLIQTTCDALQAIINCKERIALKRNALELYLGAVFYDDVALKTLTFDTIFNDFLKIPKPSRDQTPGPR